MNREEAFAPSGSPYFNELLKAAREVLDGAPLERLGEGLDFMRAFLDEFEVQYRKGMEVRETTPLKAAVDERVHRDLAALRSALARMERYGGDPLPEHLLEGAAAGRQAVESMFREFERLRAEDERQPRFSTSPFVHELVRVARGVGRGEFPTEALRERLAFMYERCRESRALQEQHAASGSLTPEAEDLLADIRERLDEMQAGLDEMGAFLAEGDADRLEEGTRRVQEAAGALVEAWNALQEATRPPSLHCPRCGAENPVGVRRCGACSGVLPEVAPPAPSPLAGLDVREGAPPPRPVPAHLLVLEKAVEAVLEGRAPAEDLQPTLEWFAEGVRRGRQEFEAWRPPAAWSSADEQEAMESSRDWMEHATSEALEAVEHMRGFFQSGNPDRLREGMDRLQRAADLLVTAHEIAQSVAPES